MHMRHLLATLGAATTISSARAQSLVKATLRLKWLPQAQFAGFYLAVDEGRHADLLWLQGEIAGLAADLGQHPQQYVIRAGEPGGDGLAAEIGQRLDRAVGASGEDEGRQLVCDADADDRQRLVTRGKHAVRAARKA